MPTERVILASLVIIVGLLALVDGTLFFRAPVYRTYRLFLTHSGLTGKSHPYVWGSSQSGFGGLGGIIPDPRKIEELSGLVVDQIEMCYQMSAYLTSSYPEKRNICPAGCDRTAVPLREAASVVSRSSRPEFSIMDHRDQCIYYF
jgi:hypothetical protein